MSFDQLGLSADLLRAVSQQGYTQPTPIQAQAIPAVLSGRDVLAAAQTGTGKTAGFTLPLLQRLSEKPVGAQRPVRALILTPTRELAAQVQDNLTGYGRHLQLRSAVIYGGVGMQPQIAKLQKGVDVVVATPGRLLDLCQQGVLNLKQLETLVLDEADRMLDMGFIHDIRRILKLLPPKRQNLMFSATFSDAIRSLAKTIVVKPVEIDVSPRNSATELVAQQVYWVNRTQKTALLTHLIQQEQWQQVLVFTRTKHGANKLAQKLDEQGIRAAAIHGNKSQSARTKALGDFKSGRITALVATDIAARGIDIEQLPQVVNFDLPNVAEDYVHRIGRTGRAGALGKAVSLVCAEERNEFRQIEKLLKRKLPQDTVAGFAFSAEITEAPEPQRRQQQKPSRRQASARPAQNKPAHTARRRRRAPATA
jgi:ATP-dependent RNA helicase RhlE